MRPDCIEKYELAALYVSAAPVKLLESSVSAPSSAPPVTDGSTLDAQAIAGELPSKSAVDQEKELEKIRREQRETEAALDKERRKTAALRAKCKELRSPETVAPVKRSRFLGFF